MEISDLAEILSQCTYSRDVPSYSRYLKMSFEQKLKGWSMPESDSRLFVDLGNILHMMHFASGIAS